MGIFLNPGARPYQMALHSEIYVDKAGLLALLNPRIDTAQRFVCISRPRRFGKTITADMVSAYYDRTVDGAELFQGLAITADPSFEEERNRFDVIHLGYLAYDEVTSSVSVPNKEIMMEFVNAISAGGWDEIVRAIKASQIVELKWDKNAKTAIRQIKERQYVRALQAYHGKVLLVGINDSKKTKAHTCQMEVVVKRKGSR